MTTDQIIINALETIYPNTASTTSAMILMTLIIIAGVFSGILAWIAFEDRAWGWGLFLLLFCVLSLLLGFQIALNTKVTHRKALFEKLEKDPPAQEIIRKIKESFDWVNDPANQRREDL